MTDRPWWTRDPDEPDTTAPDDPAGGVDGPRAPLNGPPPADEPEPWWSPPAGQAAWPPPAPSDGTPGYGTGSYPPPGYPPPGYTEPSYGAQSWGAPSWGAPTYGDPQHTVVLPVRKRGPRRAALAALTVVAVGVAAVGTGLVSFGSSGPTGVSNVGRPTVVSPISAGASTQTIAARVIPGVVDVNSTLSYQRAVAAGTGMVLTSSGYILTNNHVVEGATSIKVTVVTTGRTYTATVVGTDPTADVAVIKASGASGLTPIPIGDSSSVAVGNRVVAIGNAGGKGGTPSVVSGTVSALDQSITATDQGGGQPEQLSGLIQTDAPIQAGDSGGPLVSAAGAVIGMDTAASAANETMSATSTGFAIPINAALGIARQIEAGNASDTIHIGANGFLGVEVSDRWASDYRRGFGFGGGDPYSNSNGVATPGAIVSGTTDGSPAQRAGLQEGDLITSVDGQDVVSSASLTTLLGSYHPGDKVTIGWTDGVGETHSATVTLTTGPIK